MRHGAQRDFNLNGQIKSETIYNSDQIKVINECSSTGRLIKNYNY